MSGLSKVIVGTTVHKQRMVYFYGVFIKKGI